MSPVCRHRNTPKKFVVQGRSWRGYDKSWTLPGNLSYEQALPGQSDRSWWSSLLADSGLARCGENAPHRAPAAAFFRQASRRTSWNFGCSLCPLKNPCQASAGANPHPYNSRFFLQLRSTRQNSALRVLFVVLGHVDV